MKALPSDIVTLQELYRVVEHYLATLNHDLVEAKALVADWRLITELGDRANGITLPERSISSVPPTPPQLASDFGLPSDSLVEALDNREKYGDEFLNIVSQKNVSPSDMVMAATKLLPLREALLETYSELGNRVLLAINAVSEGRPIQTWPDKPNVKLTKVRRRLFDACWELADWSIWPPKAKTREVVMQTWGDEERESTSLKQEISRLNTNLMEQSINVAIDRKGDVIILDLPGK